MKVPLQSQFPYHVSTRCINKEWFTLPMSDVWMIMTDRLHFIQHAFNIEILAFVLMSNHFHLLVRTPLSNLDIAMCWFLRETSRELTRQGNRINQTFKGRFFRSLIGSNHYFLHAYKYLYANPLKAGLTDRVENYPFSTLPGLLGFQRQDVPIVEDLTLFSDVEGTLDWLNRPADATQWHAVRCALQRKEFKLSKRNGRAHTLESILL